MVRLLLAAAGPVRRPDWMPILRQSASSGKSATVGPEAMRVASGGHAVGTLELRTDGRIATVALNRPERMNALDAVLARELVAVGRALAEDPTVGAVVLTGTGRAFCAGADLTPDALPIDPARPGESISRVLRDLFNPIVRTWALFPKPVVVALNGVAAGGGVGLALCGDVLLMAEEASLVQVFVPRLGLVPEADLKKVKAALLKACAL